MGFTAGTSRRVKDAKRTRRGDWLDAQYFGWTRVEQAHIPAAGGNHSGCGDHRRSLNIPRVVFRIILEARPLTAEIESKPEADGRSTETKKWRKSNGVTERRFHLRVASTKSSILCTVSGAKTYVGSSACSSKSIGTHVSSIFAARDKHATVRS
ncbi:ubiquitin carboxyl-terminal hydrolase 34 [Striga asiatica]|uniref:Ubiquitin carboxyl-terminal hydrolase 34 n=1 Tax=Striga asiatica TaxID=4170 RepID=A0A5A7PWM1_STRAF|nr:ubiquitin carboxyl-terminal hydrolase 34 [Striga asiatica]